MEKKIKVCCFCEKWESGGIESFLANIIQHFDLEKLQVDIVTACLCESVFTRPLQNLGVRFFELSGKQQRLIQNHKLFFTLLQHERYDIVHFNLFQGLSLIYVRIARQVGIPMRIAHSHNTALRKSATRPLKQLLHRIAKGVFTKEATDLWACSKSAAEFLFSRKALNQKGFQFIPNGIKIEHFRFDPDVREQVRAELGLEGKFVVGNIGRLCCQKNQSFLLDVFAQVKQKRPDSCLLLVGKGELRKKLEEKARRLGIVDSVIFYGVTSHVERLLWAMDVFTFPSLFEGFGIVAIESQAAGLPIICSEKIPPEAEVSPLFRRAPLSAESVEWAKQILNTQGRIPNGADIVRDSGFDISLVAKQIEDCYLG